MKIYGYSPKLVIINFDAKKFSNNKVFPIDIDIEIIYLELISKYKT